MFEGTDFNTLIFAVICILLLILLGIQKWQHTKRENDLLDRLMAASHSDYIRNKVVSSSKIKKPEYIGEVTSPEEADLVRVD